MNINIFFQPAIKFLVCVYITILIDTVSGVVKAILLKKFSSFKFRKGIIKIIEYTSAILLVFMIAFLTQQIKLANSICIIIMIIEGTSIIENITNSNLKEKLKDFLGGLKNVTK